MKKFIASNLALIAMLTASPALAREASNATAMPGAVPSPGVTAPDIAPKGDEAAAAFKPSSKVNTLLNFWYDIEDKTNPTFKFRRVFLYFTGQTTPDLSYMLLLDPSKALALPTLGAGATPGSLAIKPASGDDKMIIDAYMKYTFGWGYLQAGQMLPLISADALQSSVTMPFIRRALFNESSTQIGFIRDLGVQGSWQVAPQVQLLGMVLNGEDAAQADRNNTKNVSTRLNYVPTPGVTLGLSGYFGAQGAAFAPKNRYGADAAWRGDKAFVLGEVLSAQDGPASKLGYELAGGYNFNPSWQGVARFESWNPDMTAGLEQRNVTLGLNWWYAGKNKLAGDYIREMLPNGDVNNVYLFLTQFYI